MYCKSLEITWSPPSQSELTPIVFNTGLTHLGSEAFISSLELVDELFVHINKFHLSYSIYI